jgi:hypothetical protein
MACKRSAVRSRLAPPRFALRATRGAATQEPEERSVVPGVALLGEDGLEDRCIPEHNAGKSTHTAKFKPWELVWYCAFPDKFKAL